MPVVLPSLAFVAAIILLFLDVEPVPTWFYVFAWYPTLLLLDETAHRVGKRPRALRQPWRLVSLFGWSAVIWLIFEAANFRLDNWYYIFLPPNPMERWAGILLSFGTVIPAVLLAERALESLGIGTAWKPRPMTLRSVELNVATALGAAQLACAILWPRLFFPLIWGAGVLLAEPFVYRRRPDLSLFADFQRGNWGRAARLMLGGLGIGLLWESYNYWARGKWVYTVPWLEGSKWFEMPPFGFIGFSFFALEAWAMYAALCSLGVAVPLDDPNPHRRGRTIVAGIAGVAFAILVLLGMERWTVSSVVPRLADLPGVDHARAESLIRSGIRTPFALARTSLTTIRVDGTSDDQADSLVVAARLAVLRGIGTIHLRQLREIGVDNVCRLSFEVPDLLWTAIHLNESARRPTRAEVRVWVAAAKRACPPAVKT